jgi:hypothetical protein
MSAFSLLGGIAGAALGGPAGAALGASIGGGIDRNSAAAESAKQAQAFSASQYASRYQTQVKDMEAAGLNPMLAYMQSPGASPQGVTYQPTNIAERAASDYSSAYNVKRLGEKIEEETENVRSQTKLNEAQVEQVNKSVEKMSAEIRNLDTDNERLKALIDNLREERQNLIKQGWNLTETGNMLRATTQKLVVEVPYLTSRSFLNHAQEELTKLEAGLKRFDLTSAQKFDNFGRDAAQLRPILDVLKALIRPR